MCITLCLIAKCFVCLLAVLLVWLLAYWLVGVVVLVLLILGWLLPALFWLCEFGAFGVGGVLVLLVIWAG